MSSVLRNDSARETVRIPPLQAAVRDRRRHFWGTLRVKLTLWNTAVLVVVIALVLLGVSFALRLTLIRELDTELADDVLELALAVQQAQGDVTQIQQEFNRKARGHADRALAVRLVDERGQMLAHAGNMPTDVAGVTSHSASALSRSSEFEQQDGVKLQTIGRYRVAFRALRPEGLPHLTLRLAVSLNGLERDVAQVTRVSAGVGIVILFLAPLGGYFLAYRNTRPLANIIHTAARLRPQRLNDRLLERGTGDELDELAGTINRLLDRIAGFVSAKRQFVADAAHELRSPLAAIQTNVEAALAGAREIAEYQELLAEVAEQCSDLAVLVNQLLLLAEADSGGQGVQRKPARLDELLRRSVDMFLPVAEERKIALEVAELPEITAEVDPDRLRQVFNNMLDNALKFAPSSGRVDVALLRDADAQQAVIVVRDSGPGIPAADLPQVFDRFFRGDKSRRRDSPQGTGLGLSICQSIVEAHGGQIVAANADDGRPGAVLTVRLPLSPETIVQQ